MALSNAQGVIVAPDLAQHLQALDQAVGMGRQTLQRAVELVMRHDQAQDWRSVRESMAREQTQPPAAAQEGPSGQR